MWHDLTQSIQSIVDAVADALSLAPAWVASLVILAALVAAACVLHAVIVAALRRLSRESRPYLRSVVEQTKNLALFALLLIALAIALQTAPLTNDAKTLTVRLLVLGTICLIGWIALTAANVGAGLYLLRFRLDVEDNLVARKHVTQIRVLMRVLDTVIVLVTLGFALMTFDAVRQYGVSLFASAGVAGVIFGLAAQPVLSNLIAGVQIAVTQPIRLEDAVTVQNEYGWIEEINATYVVIRLWDLRRLDRTAEFFHPAAVLQLDAAGGEHDRQRPDLSGLHRTDRLDPPEGDRTGRPIGPPQYRGGECAGHQSAPRLRRAACADQVRFSRQGI